MSSESEKIASKVLTEDPHLPYVSTQAFILSSSEPSIITSGKMLLVEGQDEVKFFEALLKHLGIKDVQIHEVGGKDKFPNKFSAFLNDPNFDQVTAYAIIRDADSSHTSTFNSIKGLLEKYGQPCPEKSGQFVNTGACKVGVFIIPGNAETGMLESLCLQTVVDHPIMPCVESFMQCAGESLVRKTVDQLKDRGKAYYPRNEHKAKALAFLSGMHEATTSVGLAAQKGYWPLDHDALAELRSFLKKLAE